MAWELYAIIFVFIIWFIHWLYNLGINRIDDLIEYYEETGVPIVIESGRSKGKTFNFKYVNVSEMPIIAFWFMIEITNIGKENTYEEYLITLDSDLKPLYSRKLKLESTLLDVEKQEIIDIFPVKAQFLDGSFWNIK